MAIFNAPIIVQAKKIYSLSEFQYRGKQEIEDRYLERLLNDAETLYALKSQHIVRPLCVIQGHYHLTPDNPLHTQGELLYFVVAALANLQDCNIGEYYLTANWKAEAHYLRHHLFNMKRYALTYLGQSLLSNNQMLLHRIS